MGKYFKTDKKQEREINMTQAFIDELKNFGLDEISELEAMVKAILRDFKAMQKRVVKKPSKIAEEETEVEANINVGDFITFTMNKKTYTKQVEKINAKTFTVDFSELGTTRTKRYIKFENAIRTEERIAA